jgi:hypothetical protein
MAGFYNPYGGYNPYGMTGYPPPSMVPNMGQQGAQMGQQTPQSGPDWIMAPSIKQVEQVSVQPGQKAWIMIQNDAVFALRTADNMGLVTTDYYRFEKFDPEAAAPMAATPEYVTRKEFDDFVASLKTPTKKKGDAE